MKQFLITFTGQHKKWNIKNENDWEVLNKKHAEWMKKFTVGVKAASKLLATASKTINPKSDLILDGPFAETKEVLTGFYLFEAENLAQAAELAKGCPWLLHDKLEVFELDL